MEGTEPTPALPGTTFECSLDLAEFTACPNPLAYSNLSDGPHELLVRAVGPQGTVDLTPAEYAWEVGDPTPTVVTIHKGRASSRSTRRRRSSSASATRSRSPRARSTAERSSSAASLSPASPGA